MGATIARNAAIFLLVAAVQVAFAIPVATCQPVGASSPASTACRVSRSPSSAHPCSALPWG